MEDVDWETIRRVTKSLPVRQRATKAKYTYRWNYTKVQGHLFEEEDNDLCPLCSEVRETNSHMLRCECEAMVTHRTEAIEAYKEELEKIGTNEEITRLMLRFITSDQEVTCTGNDNSVCGAKLRETLERQKYIGGANFELGWWTEGWKELHDKFRSQGSHSKYSGDKWAPRAQKALWRYVLSHWTHRNSLVNGKDESKRRHIERQRIEQMVREKYGERPQVGRRKDLFRCTVGEILRKSTHHLQHWLRDVDTAVRVEKRRQERRRRGKHTIRRYLIDRRREVEQAHETKILYV